MSIVTQLFLISTILFAIIYHFTRGDLPIVLNIQNIFLAKVGYYRRYNVLPLLVSFLTALGLTYSNAESWTSLHTTASVLFLITIMYETTGLPAMFQPIHHPEFTTVEIAEAKFPEYLSDEIIGIKIGEEIRAYPTIPLKMAHIVNDQIGEMKITVSHCALCRTSIVYNRMIDGEEVKIFPTSSTHESNLIMVDEKGRFWQQMNGVGLSKSNKNQVLEVIPSSVTTWSEWKKLYPQSKLMDYKHKGVMALNAKPFDMMMRRQADPAKKPLFPVTKYDDSYNRKEHMFGFSVNDSYFAIPTNLIGSNIELNTEFNDTPVFLYYNRESGDYGVFVREVDGETLNLTVDVKSDNTILKSGEKSWTFDGKSIDGSGDLKVFYSVFPVYWFGWYARFPETTVLAADDLKEKITVPAISH